MDLQWRTDVSSDLGVPLTMLEGCEPDVGLGASRRPKTVGAAKKLGGGDKPTVTSV